MWFPHPTFDAILTSGINKETCCRFFTKAFQIHFASEMLSIWESAVNWKRLKHLCHRPQCNPFHISTEWGGAICKRSLCYKSNTLKSRLKFAAAHIKKPNAICQNFSDLKNWAVLSTIIGIMFWGVKVSPSNQLSSMVVVASCCCTREQWIHNRFKWLHPVLGFKIIEVVCNVILPLWKKNDSNKLISASN